MCHVPIVVCLLFIDDNKDDDKYDDEVKETS